MNNTSIPHKDVMNQLKNKHDVLVDMIGNKPFHFVDIPVYGNVGDLLIMEGTLTFFEKHNLKPKSISPFFSFDTNWVEEGDVIVFQGGGNFGDLYPWHQNFREKVIQAKKNNKIIILPQSIHFSSVEERKKSAKVFQTHPNIHFCVRDYVSFEEAKEFTDKVYLLPDMAHQLYPMQSNHQPSKKALLISRVDGEKSAPINLKNIVISTTTDWPEFVNKRESTINYYAKGMKLFYRTGMGKFGNKILSKAWISYSRYLISEAQKLFAEHEVLYTDRLHGHILACLMNKKNTVMDNSYGKNSRYLNAWTKSSDIVFVQ